MIFKKIIYSDVTYFPSVGGSDRILVKAAAASSRAQDTLDVSRLRTWKFFKN